jgi:hypothetical protein
LGIFSFPIDDCVEVYMDSFTIYGNNFEEVLANLEKVLITCQEKNLELSHEKHFVFQTKGIVLGHCVSSAGIKADPKKIEVISKIPMPKNKKNVRSFLGHLHCLNFLQKIMIFFGIYHAELHLKF